MVPRLLVLALEFHRAPIRFGYLTDPARPLPEAFGDWLVESSSALAPANIETTAELLGTRPEAILEVFLFFLRQVLLVPQADPYRVLGLSRRSSAESVKQHHGLLVRMFHPDRRSETDERSVVLTARINAAYQVLRDPESRRRYDRQSPRVPDEVPWGEGGSDFFRPQAPLAPICRHAPAAPAPPTPSSPLWLWGLAGTLLTALVSLVIWEPRQPVLRANPQLADRAASGPSYLEGGEPRVAAPNTGAQVHAVSQPSPKADLNPDPRPDPSPIVTTGPARTPPASNVREQVPSVVPIQQSAAIEVSLQGHAPSGQADPEPAVVQSPEPPRPEAVPQARERKPPPEVPPAPKAAAQGRAQVDVPVGPGLANVQPDAARPRDSVGTSAGHRNRPPKAQSTSPEGVSRLIGRLEQSFAAGDLPGLVSLFTANAVVNQGAGPAAIRRAFSDLDTPAAQRRMTIAGLTWGAAPDQRLLGRGSIRISTRSGSQADWRSAAGSIELELVPWMGDYRIAKMIYHLSPK
jgi:hypothetical protein